MRNEAFLIAGAAAVLMATACDKASSITGPEVAYAKPAFDLGSGPIALDVPYTFREERLWICVCLRLHILGQSESDCTGFRRTRQHAHSFGQ